MLFCTSYTKAMMVAQQVEHSITGFRSKGVLYVINWHSSLLKYMRNLFGFGLRSILWSHRYPLFWTLDDSAHVFKARVDQSSPVLLCCF